jgi:cytochrome c oxidase subunit 2
VENGKALFTTLGCVACHSTGSNVIIGPGLAGVTTRSGEAQIRQSITDPAAVITEGFQNLMPPTFATLSESDLGDLVAYLGTLR